MTKVWSPDEELRLVRLMSARPGSESAAFFGAHGLGDAYHAAGQYNSKQAKVASALQAARQRGDREEILSAMAAELDESPDAPAVEKAGGRTPVAGGKIFISHASVDAPLGKLVERALRIGGIPPDRIFFSSDRVTGIPAGQGVEWYLRKSLQDAALVVELITETFITRPMCLMELGGAWVAETPTFPIVVPPLTHKQAVAAIGDVHLLTLVVEGSNAPIFNELHDRVRTDVQLVISARQWAEGAADFDKGLSDALAEALATHNAAAKSSQSSTQPAAGHDAVSDDDDVFTYQRVVIRGDQMIGEVINRDRRTRTAIIRVTFYDTQGTIAGTDTTTIVDARPGRPSTFTFHEIPTHTDYRFEAMYLN